RRRQEGGLDRGAESAGILRGHRGAAQRRQVRALQPASQAAPVARPRSARHDAGCARRAGVAARRANVPARGPRRAPAGEGREEIPRAVREKALAAIRGAGLVVLVIDASAGVLPGDRAAARAIREAGAEAVVAANKIDCREGSEGEVEAWELGFAEVYGVSAEHGTGVDDIQAAIASRTRGSEEERHAEVSEHRGSEIALAVLGRPNVGHSS